MTPKVYEKPLETEDEKACRELGGVKGDGNWNPRAQNDSRPLRPRLSAGKAKAAAPEERRPI